MPCTEEPSLADKVAPRRQETRELSHRSATAPIKCGKAAADGQAERVRRACQQRWGSKTASGQSSPGWRHPLHETSAVAVRECAFACEGE